MSSRFTEAELDFIWEKMGYLSQSIKEEFRADLQALIDRGVVTIRATDTDLIVASGDQELVFIRDGR